MRFVEFQDKYPTKGEKIEAVRAMTDEEIDELIDTCQNIYGKIVYSRMKKKNQIARYTDKYRSGSGDCG